MGDSKKNLNAKILCSIWFAYIFRLVPRLVYTRADVCLEWFLGMLHCRHRASDSLSAKKPYIRVRGNGRTLDNRWYFVGHCNALSRYIKAAK